MAIVATINVTRGAGVTDPTPYAAQAGGDKCVPGGDVWLHTRNTSAQVKTITVATPGKVRGLDIADATFDVAATTGETVWGPLPADVFAGSDGLVSLSYAPDETGLAFGVLKLGQA